MAVGVEQSAEKAAYSGLVCVVVVVTMPMIVIVIVMAVIVADVMVVCGNS